MRRRLHRKVGIQLLLVIVLFITAKATMAAESTTANEPIKINQNTVTEEYQQKLSRLDVISRAIGGDLTEMETIAQNVQNNRIQLGEERYSTLIWTICRVLDSHDFGIPNSAKRYNLVRKYATLALQQNEEMSLRTETGLLLCMPGQTQSSKSPIPVEVWIAQRVEETKLWLHALQRLNKEIDPNFNLSRRYLPYINPPPGYENFPSPVSPEVIKDPQVRAKYAAALAENVHKSEEYAKQRYLRDLHQLFTPFVEKYLTEAYSTPPYNTEELTQYLNLYVQDEAFKNKIVQEVTAAIQHNSQNTKDNTSQTTSKDKDNN